MKRVYKAQPYSRGRLGSSGKARYMLLRQFQFPDTFDEKKDKHTYQDHVQCMLRDYEHSSSCFKEYTGTGELGLEGWISNVKDERVLSFLKHILKVQLTDWTGYRVLGSVHPGNNHPTWTFELFWKHPESKTNVYSGGNAPNVRPLKSDIIIGWLIDSL